MKARRRSALFAFTACALATVTLAAAARAQTAPQPAAPGAAIPVSDSDRAMLQPLVEIGRVRAVSPYCAALARAGAGADAVVAYGYQAPQVAKDLRNFRFDSGLTHAQSLKQAERDLNVLWDLTLAGRDDVLALRTVAQNPSIDADQRKEMLAFANALDGAKQRQQLLAKDIARVVAVYAEVPIRTMTQTAADDRTSAHGLNTKMVTDPDLPANAPTAPPNFFNTEKNGVPTNWQRQQDLFSTFAAEDLIRDDVRTASEHAAKALKLGHCNPQALPAPQPSP